MTTLYGLGCFFVGFILTRANGRNSFVWFYLFPIFIAYAVFGFTGLLLLKLDFLQDTYFTEAIETDAVIDSAILLTLESFFFFISTFFIFNSFFRIFGFRGAPKQIDPTHLSFDGLGTLIVIYIVIAIYYLVSIHPSPLMMSVTDGPDVAYARRIAVTRDYAGIGYLSTLARSLSYVLSIGSLLYFLGRRSGVSAGLAMCCISLAVVVILSNGEKAPLGLLFAALFYILFFLTKRKKVAFYGLIGTILLVVISYAIYSEDSLSESLVSISHRILTGQMISIPLSIQYHNAGDFTGTETAGSSTLRTLLGTGDAASPPMSQYLMWYYFPEMTKNGAFNVNGLFYGEGYGWAGRAGSILSSVYLGLMSACFLAVASVVGNRGLFTAFVFYISTSVTGVMTSLSLVLLSTSHVLTLAVIFMAVALSKKTLHGRY